MPPLLRHLVTVVCFGSCLNFIAGQDARMSDASKAALNSVVQVILTSDKSVYQRGESITVRAELRNIGTQPFYIYPKVQFGLDGNGIFRVYLKPLQPCRRIVRGEFIDEAAAPPLLEFADYIQKTWRLLRPGELISVTASGVVSAPCPGRYELGGEYFTKLQAWSGKRIAQSESKLQYPVAFGSFRATPSIIEVQGECTPFPIRNIFCGLPNVVCDC